MNLLDIGCGFLFVKAANKYHVHSTGITPSEEQFHEFEKRIREEGLEELLTVKLIDYRDLSGYEKDSETATKIIISEPKTKNSIREIPIITPLYDLLKNQYERQSKCAEFLGTQLKKDTFVVTNEVLKFYEPKTYQELFEKHVEASGIEKANFHALRHTFATSCIEHGMDIVVLSKILGHASPSTTMNKYGHALEEQKKSSMESLGDFYERMTMNM